MAVFQISKLKTHLSKCFKSSLGECRHGLGRNGLQDQGKQSPSPAGRGTRLPSLPLLQYHRHRDTARAPLDYVLLSTEIPRMARESASLLTPYTTSWQ